MADSLFDNRYRYDYIYPRGRSGETLRAVDTQGNDAPVVIKRPAPNDAPPIRAGQEVSILNERKALKRLAGNPTLTELVGEGQFFVGGQPHQYIVVERATGMIVADQVLTLARSGERLPQLEMLVIVDQLLDLLRAAHAKDIVYNDVDAKHLFWSREHYRLKVIDWGNAVFLEGDNATPQGISRQTDIFQVGELLYFILTGGKRADVPRDAGADYRIDFGDDSELVSRALQAIVSKALHPNLKYRYQDIDTLRRELTDYRRPIERERDTVINHLSERLRRDLSKTELRTLTTTLEPLLKVDPGYPDIRRIRAEIDNRLRDLEVSADLDAVKIYMTGGNWAKAADLLNELRDKAGTNTSGLVELLLDSAMLMLESNLSDSTPAISQAIDAILGGKMVKAANILLLTDTDDDESRKYQWLLAERISSRIPDVLLTQPNLYRLRLALNDLKQQGVKLDKAERLLNEVSESFDAIAGQTRANIAELRDAYRVIVDRLNLLSTHLSELMIQERLTNRHLPLNSLDRLTNATMALADNMHVIGKQAVSSPRDALVALDNSRAIDPTTPLWERLSEWLDVLYELLQSYQTYVPSADGSDIAEWHTQTEASLTGYTESLFDEILVNMVEGVRVSAQNWRDYGEVVLMGDRTRSLETLEESSQAIYPISPSLASWLGQLRAVVAGSSYIQRHAIFGGLGRALADGYEVFDRGRMAEAEQLGQRAVEIASSETQKFVAERLLNLAGVVREWIERGGVESASRTQNALTEIEALYTDEELRERERFAMQMPSRETYMKAVSKGLIESYQRHSTPALRIFYFNTILNGTLEAHQAQLEGADFWVEVAIKTLGDYGVRHPATQALTGFVARRRTINAVGVLLNNLCDKSELANINAVRRALLTDGQEVKSLQDAGQSLRDFEAGLRQWADADFKGAGLKLESAMNLAKSTEKAAGISLNNYIGWLNQLIGASAELHNLYRQMRQTVERRPPEPSDIVRRAHQEAVQTTYLLLGEPYHAQLQNWHDTYEQFLTLYTDNNLRRSAKLERFNEAFKALFLDRHPAYDLYRHWYDIIESASEFPAPPTQEPTPRIQEEEEPQDAVYLSGFDALDDEDDEQDNADDNASASKGFLKWLGFIGLIVVLLAGVVVFILPNLGGRGGQNDDLTSVGSVATEASVVMLATEEQTHIPTDDSTDEPTSISTEEPTNTPHVIEIDPIEPIVIVDPNTHLHTETPTQIPSLTPVPSVTPIPSETPIPSATPTETPIPTDTPEATATPTFTPSATFTPTITPTPTLPPQGIQGTQDLLAILADVEGDWTEEQLSFQRDAWRLGVSEGDTNGRIAIVMPVDALDTLYGNNAPSRIRRMETNLAFATYNPSSMELSDVNFGVFLQSVNDPSIRVGVRIDVVDMNTVNLYTINNDQETFAVQYSVNTLEPRLRLERDASNGMVTIFYDDVQVGQPLAFIAPEALIQPAVFVRDGGAILNIHSWRVTLR